MVHSVTLFLTARYTRSSLCFVLSVTHPLYGDL